MTPTSRPIHLDLADQARRMATTTVGGLLNIVLGQQEVEAALATGDPAIVEAMMAHARMGTLALTTQHWRGMIQLGGTEAFGGLLHRRGHFSDSLLLEALLDSSPKVLPYFDLWCEMVDQHMPDLAPRQETLLHAARAAVDGQAWAQAQQALKHLTLNRDNLIALVARAAERDAPPVVFDAILARSQTGQPLYFGLTVEILVRRDDWARLKPLVRHCTTEQALLSLRQVVEGGRQGLAEQWLDHLLPEQRQEVLQQLRSQAESRVHPASAPTENDWRVLDAVGVWMPDHERESWAQPWLGHLPLTEQRILAQQREEQARDALGGAPTRPRRRS